LNNFLISDSNVFVFLINAGVYQKIFAGTRVTVYVTKAVIEEITDGNVIPRRHPQVRTRFLKDLHSPFPDATDVNLLGLLVDDVRSEDAINYYFRLLDENELDKGELESIVLSKDLNITFVSDDDEAIEECEESDVPHQHFLKFIKEMLLTHVIDQLEYDQIKTAMMD
jgi:hypothetical protein